MKLYYTGAKIYLTAQINKEKSLGGFPSITPIPNSQLGNLFSNISSYTLQNEIMSVIGVVLKNETGLDLSNVSFYFNLPEVVVGEYQIAAVNLSIDSNGRYYMEEIGNSNSLPYYATFYSANGVENAIDLGPIQSNGMLGLWIKRIVTFNSKTDDQLWEDFINGVQDINKENITLVFEYDESDIDSSDSSSSA